MNTKNKLCSRQFYAEVIHFQSHPKYCNVLAVSLTNSNVLLFHIDIDNNKMEEKVKYKNQSHRNIYKTLFSPYDNGTILASLFYDNISIWDMNSYYYIYNIHFDNKSIRSKNLEIKWSKSGKYLVFQRYSALH